MTRLFTQQFAATCLLVILSLVVGFHALVLVGVVPFKIVWGGRLQTRQQMLVFETVSIFINAVMIATVAAKINLLKWRVRPVFIKVMLWVMTGLFTANTVGNLFSNNGFERVVFTPLTGLLALLCLRLVWNEASSQFEQG